MNDNTLTIEQFDKLFEKYFKTLDTINKENEELKILNEELQQKELEQKKIDEEFNLKQLQNDISTDQEFRQYVLEKLDTNNLNLQYINNFFYWSIVVTGTILISVLLYKFLKIFI